MTGLLTIGEAMLTVSPERVGPLKHSPGAVLSMAGSEATVAIGVARLGHRATWLSRLGDDEAGELVAQRLRGEGVEVVAPRGPGPTGLMLKERPTSRRRRARYYRTGSAASALSPADLAEPLLAGAEHLHVSGITVAVGPGPAALVDVALQRAAGAGTRTSLDVNHRAQLWSAEQARAALLPMLPRVDVLFAGLDEARLLLEDGQEDPDPVKLAGRLRELGAGAAVVTCGRAGAAYDDGAGAALVPAVAAVEVDPFGAGDAFVAGFLASTLDGGDIESATRTGALVAAHAVAVEGDWEGLPTAADLANVSAGDIVR